MSTRARTEGLCCCGMESTTSRARLRAAREAACEAEYGRTVACLEAINTLSRPRWQRRTPLADLQAAAQSDERERPLRVDGEDERARRLDEPLDETDELILRLDGEEEQERQHVRLDGEEERERRSPVKEERSASEVALLEEDDH